MRIITEYKDYYDCIQSWGQEPLVYQRSEKLLEFDKNPLQFEAPKHRWHVLKMSGVLLTELTIGFCGKLHRLIRLTRLGGSEKYHAYNIDDIDAYVKQHYNDKAWEAYCFKGRSYADLSIFERSYRHKWCWYSRRQNFEDYFNAKHPVCEHLFVDNYCPLFFSTDSRDIKSDDKTHIIGWNDKPNKAVGVVLNGHLKQFEFYKVFDAYQAFQEISMYLGSMAVPLKEVPHIDDRTMAEAKGFDKFSFRKDKKEKK